MCRDSLTIETEYVETAAPPCPSREAAKECSPRRKPWVVESNAGEAPKGRKKLLPEPICPYNSTTYPDPTRTPAFLGQYIQSREVSQVRQKVAATIDNWPLITSP